MSEPAYPDCIVIEPDGEVVVSVIWLHGLGANGHDFAPVADLLSKRLEAPIRFILPHAPTMPVTLNGGMPMPAWYDMYNMEHPRNVNWDTVDYSERMIVSLIQREQEKGVPPSRCMVAGFSQGGAMALRIGLTGNTELAGVIALSSYLLRKEGETFPSERGMPIFMAHGDSDPVIPIAVGESSRETIKSHGYELEWHEYPMQHNVCEQEIKDIEAWMRNRIKQLDT